MYFFNEPAEPFTCFTYYDILFLSLITVFNYFISTKRIKIRQGAVFKVFIFILFFILIPYISNAIELHNIHDKFEVTDGFNLLYLILKFPVWWALGVFEVLFLISLKKNSN